MAEIGERLEDEIQRLLSNHWMVETPSEDPSRQVLVMRYPTLDQKLIGRFFKQKFVRDNATSMMSREEAEKAAFINGAWLPAMDTRLDNLTSRYELLNESLEFEEEQARKIVAAKARVRALKREMQQTGYTMQSLMLQKFSIFGNTLEYHAERHRIIRLIGMNTFDIYGNPIWKDDSIQQELDLPLVEFLTNTYIEKQNFDVRMVRRVARSNLWHYRWSLGKVAPDSLFGRSVRDLSVEQNFLVFWSQVYEAVGEAAEPPPREVVEDDEEFDKWLDKNAKKQEKKKQKKRFGLDKPGNEQFVVIDGYYDDEGYWHEHTTEEKQKIADSIYGCNNPMVRRMQVEGHRRLKDIGGQARETDLRKGWFRLLGWDKVNEQST